MSEMKRYSGGCHCGQVRYQVSIALDKAMSCNCSICSKKGSLLAFVPADQFTLTAGSEAALTDYQFHKRRIHHLFCPTCGVESFAVGARPDGTKMIAVNLRCLDELDVSTLTLQHFDGRSL